jgi:hypothetical protein
VVLWSENTKYTLIEIIGWVPEGDATLLQGCFCDLGVVTDVSGKILPHLECTFEEGNQNFL